MHESALKLKSVLNLMRMITKFAGIFADRKLATLMVAGFLAASFRANAALETETLPTVLYPLTPTDYSAGLQVAQFDPSSGQLDSVTITATGTGSFTQYYQNLSTSSGGLFTISQNLDLILSLPSSGTGSLLDLNLSSGIQTHAVQPYVSGSQFFSSPSGGMADYAAQAGPSSTTLQLSSPDFAQFTGSGLVNFLLTANGSSTVAETSGNYIAGGSSLAGLDLTVSYNYTPDASLLALPEPAAWTWLAGVFALGGLLIGIHKCRPSPDPDIS